MALVVCSCGGSCSVHGLRGEPLLFGPRGEMILSTSLYGPGLFFVRFAATLNVMYISFILHAVSDLTQTNRMCRLHALRGWGLVDSRRFSVRLARVGRSVFKARLLSACANESVFAALTAEACATAATVAVVFDSPLDGPLDALQRLRELTHSSNQVQLLDSPAAYEGITVH